MLNIGMMNKEVLMIRIELMLTKKNNPLPRYQRMAAQ